MEFGQVRLTHGLLLGPMAGFTDRAMRQICRECGAEMTVSEMVSAKAIVYRDRKTASLAYVDPEDSPCAIQIFGSDPATMAEAAERLCAGLVTGRSPDMIDINMGCPMRKITSNGEGGALLADPKKIEQIVSAVARAVPVPVSVKLRTGLSAASVNITETARAAEAGGAAFLSVHGRTVAQQYSGTADRSAIAAAKSAVSVPVVGNGDVTDAASALAMRQETGCDGIMVARGAVGNPFVFGAIRDALEGREPRMPSVEERIALALRHLSLALTYKGERAIPELRGQLGGYLAGLRGAAALRRRLHVCLTEAEVREVLLQAAECMPE